MKTRVIALLLFAECQPRFAAAQSRDHPSGGGLYTQSNTFGLFAEYSNASSHIYLGRSSQRKLASVGASYTRRLFRTPAGELRYLVELHPAFEESDPVSTHWYASYNSRFGYRAWHDQPTATEACHPVTSTFSSSGYLPPNGYYRFRSVNVTTCARRWTYAQGLSPLGFQFAFRPHHRVRPFLTGNAGYLFSTRPIPSPSSGSFNFIFAFGAGIEIYNREHRALQVEYRLNHISNNFTAPSNPGIDSNLLRVAYVFGR